jgi:predicted N-formylglutamate amidohydrolase
MTAFEHIPARSVRASGSDHQKDPASSLLLICDHAVAALPSQYGLLGLDPGLFQTHIAYDIGAARVTRALAARFGAAAVLGRWSRLLIDLNRGADDPTLVMKLSDGSIIPGNAKAGPDEVARRIRDFHLPYHDAITAELDRIGPKAAIISIHSFTPAWKGKSRPWEVGVLWDQDRRLAGPLMTRLTQHAFVWGDNEPYSGALDGDTLNVHGTRRGLPHVLVEIRQDLIASDELAEGFAHKLHFVLHAALGDMERMR